MFDIPVIKHLLVVPNAEFLLVHCGGVMVGEQRWLRPLRRRANLIVSAVISNAGSQHSQGHFRLWLMPRSLLISSRFAAASAKAAALKEAITCWTIKMSTPNPTRP